MVDSCEDGLSFVLLGQVSMRRAVRSEGGGEDKTADVVIPLIGGDPVS